MQRIRTSEHPARNGTYTPQALLPRLSDHCGRWSQKSMRARGSRCLQGKIPLDTAGQQHVRTHGGWDSTHKTQARPNPSKERELGTKSTLSCGAIGNCQLLERTTVFSKSVPCCKSIVLQWETTHPRMFGQHKLVLIC